MSDTVIKVENLWKEYRLGTVSHHSMAKDLQSWWARLRGKEDPNAQIASPFTLHSSQPGDSPGEAPDRFWALQDVSFDINRGDIVGIIGRNGAGKSTLLKILSKVTMPTRGQITYKGRIASLLEVGTGFHPELTGRENIFLNGAILGMSKEEIRRKFDEIVAFAEVDAFIDTPVKRYSSGMYVRLAFAVAAHLEPEILIIDEVLAVGDAQFQKKCLGKMEDVGKAGRTVLFVSHNMNAINRLCRKAILLSAGQIECQGDTEFVIPHYLAATSRVSSSEVSITDDPLKLFQLLSISLTHENGARVERQLEVHEPFSIQMKLKINSSLNGGYATFVLKNQSDEIVLISDNRDATDSINIDVSGVYFIAVDIPAPLLTPGSYTISPAICQQGSGALEAYPDIISFEIVDLRGIRASRAGYIQTPFIWRQYGLEVASNM